MVGSGMFNFLNLQLQQIMGTQEPFGNISLVTVGDLFQLQPVFDKWIFENADQGYALLATSQWQKYFTMYELTQIMRQKDDKKYAELLNRLREGNHTKNDIASLKARLIKNLSKNEACPADITHMFITNASANGHNDNIFGKSRNDKSQIRAVDIIVGDISDELKQKVKNKIPDDATKTMGLHTLLSIAVGTKYDLTL